MNTKAIRNTLEATVPISQFNRGLAGKIFEDVKQKGAKVVMKNNTPECVLVAPDEYIKLIDELNDTKLLNLAAERLAHFDPAALISQEQMEEEFGFPPLDEVDCGEIEFE